MQPISSPLHLARIQSHLLPPQPVQPHTRSPTLPPSHSHPHMIALHRRSVFHCGQSALYSNSLIEQVDVVWPLGGGLFSVSSSLCKRNHSFYPPVFFRRIAAFMRCIIAAYPADFCGASARRPGFLPRILGVHPWDFCVHPGDCG